MEWGNGQQRQGSTAVRQFAVFDSVGKRQSPCRGCEQGANVLQWKEKQSGIEKTLEGWTQDQQNCSLFGENGANYSYAYIIVCCKVCLSVSNKSIVQSHPLLLQREWGSLLWILSGLKQLNHRLNIYYVCTSVECTWLDLEWEFEGKWLTLDSFSFMFESLFHFVWIWICVCVCVCQRESEWFGMLCSWEKNFVLIWNTTWPNATAFPLTHCQSCHDQGDGG